MEIIDIFNTSCPEYQTLLVSVILKLADVIYSIHIMTTPGENTQHCIKLRKYLLFIFAMFIETFFTILKCQSYFLCTSCC